MSVINTEYVLGLYGGVACRVLENNDIVVAWVSSNTKDWDAPPYHIKKAVSTDGGETWQTTELASSLGFSLSYWTYQRLAITSTGNVWYVGVGTEHVMAGYHNGTSWTWTEAVPTADMIGMFMKLDEHDRPFFCLNTEGSPSTLVYYDGEAFHAIESPLDGAAIDQVAGNRDNVIHVLLNKPTGHLSDWGYPDEYDFYYASTADYGETWSNIELIVRYRNVYLGSFEVDQYNNAYMCFAGYDENWYSHSTLWKRDNLGRYSSHTISDGGGDEGAVGEGFGFLSSFFPNNKFYAVFADEDAGYNSYRLRLRCFNPDGSKDEVVNFPMTTNYTYYSYTPALVLSTYNGWMIIGIAWASALPLQPQRLEFYKSEELPVTYTKREVFEIMGLITDETGVVEQNIDIATATEKWRAAGYPNIKMSDMVQVAVVKEIATGLFSAINVNDFYTNTLNNGYPPDEYEFIGLFWKNPLVEN